MNLCFSEFSSKTEMKSLCCNLESNFGNLCKDLEVQPLCDQEIFENSNEEFQKYVYVKSSNYFKSILHNLL